MRTNDGEGIAMTGSGASCADAPPSGPMGELDHALEEPAAIGESERSGAEETEPLRLMILDRDSEFIRALSLASAQRGWESHVLSSPTTRRLLARMRIQALVLDPAALGPDPWGWVDRVASGLPGLAVIVCSASSTVSERVHALQLGVDDWLNKPSNAEELVARIETAVRRRSQIGCDSTSSDPILAGDERLVLAGTDLQIAGVSVGLTRREFGVLAAIVRAEGAVVERERIYLGVWGYTMVTGDRSVDVHVRKIRRKLRRVSPQWSYVHTQFRIGYRFQPQRIGQPESES
jgi:DNA-binding response OmpR family regulator